jgi:hypothetical protein
MQQKRACCIQYTLWDDSGGHDFGPLKYWLSQIRNLLAAFLCILWRQRDFSSGWPTLSPPHLSGNSCNSAHKVTNQDQRLQFVKQLSEHNTRFVSVYKRVVREQHVITGDLKHVRRGRWCLHAHTEKQHWSAGIETPCCAVTVSFLIIVYMGQIPRR